jgi:hypothetical protein
MNGQEIVNLSVIGRIADDIKFLDGRTMADYKAVLASIADKAIAAIPGAVEQAGKEYAKNALDGMYRSAVSKTWNGSLEYWTTHNGHKAITQITRHQVDDVVRMLCNMIDMVND